MRVKSTPKRRLDVVTFAKPKAAVRKAAAQKRSGKEQLEHQCQTVKADAPRKGRNTLLVPPFKCAKCGAIASTQNSKATHMSRCSKR